MTIINFILHIDHHLIEIVNQFGGWTYLIIFGIIFVETGLVIFPFLPGDSLIFAASSMAVNPKYHLNIWLVYTAVLLAAVLGDACNYEIGSYSVHSGIKHSWFNKLINQKKRHAAEQFFERHGPITIVIGRFIPFIRTFVPFISGGSQMHYGKFALYNIVGGIVWSGLFTIIGAFFGNIPFVKDHFSMLILGIILISILPIAVVMLKKRHKQKKELH